MKRCGMQPRLPRGSLSYTYVCSFLNCTSGNKIPGRSLLDHSLQVALQDAGWATEDFIERGGIYEWTRATSPVDW